MNDLQWTNSYASLKFPQYTYSFQQFRRCQWHLSTVPHYHVPMLYWFPKDPNDKHHLHNKNLSCSKAWNRDLSSPLRICADSSAWKEDERRPYISWLSYGCLTSTQSKVSPEYNLFYWQTEPLAVSITFPTPETRHRGNVPKYRTNHPESIWMNLIHKHPKTIIRKLCGAV